MTLKKSRRDILKMESVQRLQVCLNLLLASVVAFLEIPVPRMFPGVVFHIVKRVHRYLEYNGEQDGEPFCEEVRSSQYGACDMAETDERSDGESDGGDEDESGSTCEHEPNESKDD
jgi:hypothetical protein